MRYIAGSSNAAVTGITETKLDNTVYNSEVAVDEFKVEMIVTETVVGVVVILKISFVITGRLVFLTIKEKC